MHRFATWQRWLIVLCSLPAVVIISTFIVSQTQIGQLVPADLPFQSTMWTALQFSVASGLIWLLWRQPLPLRDWSVIIGASIEGCVLFGIALSVGWYFELIELTWEFSSEPIVALVGLAIPLAWWSMAEERVLRGELSQLMPQTPPILRDIIMLGIGWMIQISLITTTNMFVFIIVILTEGLSIVTWSTSANFERTWARRWTWRWFIVVGAGVGSTGFITATPSILTITTDDPLALVVIMAAPFAAWISYSAMQNYTKA